MVASNYNYALEQVLLSEGGYTNDPRDPGGPTNFGITIYDYRAYINHAGTATDVKNMTKAQAAAIYKSKYWDAVNGDNLPSGVDYCVFDYGVNSGVSRAIKVYNQLKSDDPVKTINAICDERLNFLEHLSTWSAFGRGWSSRVASVRANSIKLAHQPVQTVPLPTPAPSSQGGTSITDVETKVTSANNIFNVIKNFFADNILKHTVAGTAAVSGASALSQLTHYWPYVLGGTIGFAGLVWLGIYVFTRKLNNVIGSN